MGALLWAAHGLSARAETVDLDIPNDALYSIDTDTYTATLKSVAFSATEGGFYTVANTVEYDGHNCPVIAVGRRSFSGHSKLQSVTMGANVMTIDSAAFRNNTALQNVNFNTAINTIGDHAFTGCSALTAISLPAGLSNIGANPFINCTALTHIAFYGTSNRYCVVNNVLFNRDKTILIAYPDGLTDQEYTVPATVTSIGKSAFMGARNLFFVNLPEGLEEIGDEAFAVSAIGSVDIPASVKSIGYNPWYSNGSLTTITVAGGSQSDYFKVQDGWLITADGKRLISTPWRNPGAVTIPDGVEEIDDYALFYQRVTTVTFPSSLRRIGQSAFYSCSSLSAATFNEGLEVIDRMAFQYTGLKSVVLPSSTKRLGIQAFSSCSAMTELSLNDDLEQIGINAFLNCNGLTSVSIPGTVNSFGIDAFAQCMGLQKVEIGEGVTEIPEGCFLLCTALTDVTLPSSLRVIGRSAFDTTLALTTIDIPEGCERLNTAAFQGAGLESLTLPASVKTIADLSVSWMEQLTSFTATGLEEIQPFAIHYNYILDDINLNEGLRVIGHAGISGCAISELTIPSTVERMDSLCLISNFELRDLYMLPLNPPLTQDDLFATDIPINLYEQVVLHVHPESLEAYREHPIWSKFSAIEGDIISGISGIIADPEARIVDIYDLQGHRLPALAPGLNIVRMSDGTIRKLLTPLR